MVVFFFWGFLEGFRLVFVEVCNCMFLVGNIKGDVVVVFAGAVGYVFGLGVSCVGILSSKFFVRIEFCSLYK